MNNKHTQTLSNDIKICMYCANRHRKKISKHKQEKILDDWLLNRVKGSEEWKSEEYKKRTRKRRGKKVGGSKYTKNKVF